MKISRKQSEEIDFLEQHFVKSKVSQEEKEDYVRWTVLGKGKPIIRAGDEGADRLMLAKRGLDITVKMWTEDIRNGLLFAYELTDMKRGGYGHPYADKVVKGILSGVNFTKAKIGRGMPSIVFANAIQKIAIKNGTTK